MIPGAYRNIALIGFMGAGKTTVAAKLAERLGWEWADGDAEVEAAAGRPVAQVFAEDGEAAFRELEEQVASRLLERVDTVIALGGGAITSPVTRERLRDGSFTVLLDVSAQTAWRRIESTAGDRPLAVEARGFAELYDAAGRSTRRPPTRSLTLRRWRAASRCSFPIAGWSRCPSCRAWSGCGGRR